MYFDFFDLEDAPFRIAPDARFVLWNKDHNHAYHQLSTALAHSHTRAALSGPVGVGKTTLLTHLLRHQPSARPVALIHNLTGQAGEVASWLLSAFDQPVQNDNHATAQLRDYLNHHHDPALIIIDEAQLIGDDHLQALDQLLSHGLAHPPALLLAGQPELDARLATPLWQEFLGDAAQSFALFALSHEDSIAYIDHRLRIAGHDPDRHAAIFSQDAKDILAGATGGIPRKINFLAERMMIEAFGEDLRTITRRAAEHSLRDACQSGFFIAATPPVHHRSGPSEMFHPETMAPPAPQTPASKPIAKPSVTQRAQPTLHENDLPPPITTKPRRALWPFLLVGFLCLGAGGGWWIWQSQPVTSQSPQIQPQPQISASEPVILDTAQTTTDDEPPSAAALFNAALAAGIDAPAKAAINYSRAALKGHQRAAEFLGQLYAVGDGVPQNPVLAAHWQYFSENNAAPTPAPATESSTAPTPVAAITDPGSPVIDVIWTAKSGGAFQIDVTDSIDAPTLQSITTSLSAYSLEARQAKFWRVGLITEGDILWSAWATLP